MIYCFNKILLVSFFVFFIYAHDVHAQENVPKDIDFCQEIHYKNSNVADKPDLLIVEENIGHNTSKIWSKLCRIKSDKSESKGEFFAGLDSSTNDEFEYDSRTDTVYQATFNYNIQTLSNGKRKDIFNYPVSVFFDNKTVLSVALDWVTKNVYVISRKDVQIYNINDNSKSPRSIIFFKREVGKAWIGVFPNEGYIVMRADDVLFKSDQDGQNLRAFYSPKTYRICKVALDHYEGRVYWIETDYWNKKARVLHTNLTREKVQGFGTFEHESGTCDGLNVQVSQNYVYFSSQVKSLNHIWRANKTDGALDADFEVVGRSGDKALSQMYDFKVLNANSQEVAENHPCKDNNGGCEHYCTAVPVHQGLMKVCVLSKRNQYVRFWNAVKNTFS